MRIKKLDEVVSWEVIGEAQKGVHPIYWFCWLVVFFPALIVVFVLHKKLHPLVELTYRDGSKISIVVPKLDEIGFLEKMDKVGATEVAEEVDHAYKQCPVCAEDIKQAAKMCRYCKEPLV